MPVYIGGVNVLNGDRLCPTSCWALKLMSQHYLITRDFKMPMDKMDAEFVLDIVAYQNFSDILSMVGKKWWLRFVGWKLIVP